MTVMRYRPTAGNRIPRPWAPAVFIRTLGPFHITCDGVPVPKDAWQSDETRLLKILIAQRRPTPRHHLIKLLWLDADPAVAGNRLSTLLSAVSNALPPQRHAGPLASDGTMVWLNPTQITLDVEEFLTHANTALHAHLTNQKDATTLLQAAAAAHTGDFLEDDPHQHWAILLAEEVKNTQIALLLALATRQQ